MALAGEEPARSSAATSDAPRPRESSRPTRAGAPFEAPEPGRAPPKREVERGFFGDLVAGIGSVIDGVVDALSWIGGGVARLVGASARAAGEVAENVGGVVLLAGGKAISGAQTWLGLEPAGRTLTPGELASMRAIFGESIDFDRVRIKEGSAGVFSVNDRAFTHGNAVYMKDARSRATLAHELVHVWQYQHGGPDYLVEAPLARALGDGYDWQKAAAEGKRWRELNPEQQGQLIEDAVSAGFFGGPEPEGARRFVRDGTDYTAFLREALAELRAGRGAP